MTCEETIAALKCADTGSRELDAGVYEALGGKVVTNVLAGYWREDGGGQVPEYTTSLDAAFALLDEVVPASRLLSLSRVNGGDGAGWTCAVLGGGRGARTILSMAATAPLALSAATVAAWSGPSLLIFPSAAASG